MPAHPRPRRFPRGSLAAIASVLPVFRPVAAPGSSPPLEQGRPKVRAHLVRRSLAASTCEGVFAEILAACAGGAVLTGWALHLGGGPFVASVLGALPFLAQLLHLPAAWLTASLGRRRVALVAVAASRQVFLPLVALPFLDLTQPAKVAVLVAVAAVSAALAVVGNNAWVAWMGDLVPRAVRGRYFARRTAWCTVGGTLAALLAGLVLDGARASGRDGPALALLALAACLAGAVTTALMARQHEPGEQRPSEPLRAADALRPFADPSARPLLVYQVAWSAAIGVSSALFAVHMLENLEMGFALIALQAAGVAAVRVVAVPLWGLAVDRLGARLVLVACSFGVTVIPLVWLLPAPGSLWPLAVDTLLSGVLWSGHSLAAFALPLTLAPRERRPFYLGAFSVASGLSFAAASAAGGLLAEALPRELLVAGRPFFGLHAIFVLSAVARLLAATLSLRVVEPGAQPVSALVHRAARRLAHPLLPSGRRP